MGFVLGLALVFITLKLTGFIMWSWWLVLIPLYPSFAFWTFILVGLIFYGATKTSKKRPF